jgi:hypothetical protein
LVGLDKEMPLRKLACVPSVDLNHEEAASWRVTSESTLDAYHAPLRVNATVHGTDYLGPGKQLVSSSGTREDGAKDECCEQERSMSASERDDCPHINAAAADTLPHEDQILLLCRHRASINPEHPQHVE